MNIIIVIDQLFKIRYLIACPNISTLAVARLFLDYIQKLYRLPETIIFNRGSQFIFIFQEELTTRLHIKVLLSTAYYLETDGQIKHINAIMEQYIQIYTLYLQDNQIDWFIFTKFTANNSVLKTIKVSPFLANYSQYL